MRKQVFSFVATLVLTALASSVHAQPSLKMMIPANPGGGWDTKNWAPENYALLHDKLRNETGLSSVLTWGPGEEPLVDRVLSACAGRRWSRWPHRGEGSYANSPWRCSHRR